MDKGIFSGIANFFKILFGIGGGTNPSPTTPSNTNTGTHMTKRAFCFSINDYKGTNNDLQGCNNDSLNWANLLKEQYGFQEVTRWTDFQVTRANVIKGMTDLITNAKAGDTLVITYSGHGTTTLDTNGDELNGKDECICLYDGNMLDDEIRAIFNRLPSGVKLTFISDSCFSGTVTRAFLDAMNDNSYVSKPRYMPPKDDLEALQLAGLSSSRGFAYPESGMNHILLSGTDDKSYSYDAHINGQPCGAFSCYAIQILKANPKITYNDFHKLLRARLPSSQYPQTPQLEGSDDNKNSLMFE